uniref:Uncharacterized protein n=1 Tax=Romanomermis culicivorax TaxID=13658 RepID=A0A915JLY0_ROMCU
MARQDQQLRNFWINSPAHQLWNPLGAMPLSSPSAEYTSRARLMGWKSQDFNSSPTFELSEWWVIGMSTRKNLFPYYKYIGYVFNKRIISDD